MLHSLASLPLVLSRKYLHIILYDFVRGEAVQGCVAAIATAVKLLQSCPTLCDPIDDSP